MKPEDFQQLIRWFKVYVSELRTLNDFKLLQISWVYDLNFQPSFRVLRKRGYLEQIAAEVPQTNEIGSDVRKSLAYVQVCTSKSGCLPPVSK